MNERNILFGGEGAAFSRNNTGCDRIVEAERRTDGSHPFAHLQLFGGTDFKYRQILGFNLYHGDIGLFIQT